MKIRDGRGKWLLRHVLDRYVPRTLIERPKCGFGVPLHEWLRGPLRKWAEELLDAGRLRQEGILDPNPVRQKWSEHLSGKHNWMAALWNVLMFQAWLEEERMQAPKTANVLSTFA
jgi:asparagine synthase (glutamine-hydrolysing)